MHLKMRAVMNEERNLEQHIKHEYLQMRIQQTCYLKYVVTLKCPYIFSNGLICLRKQETRYLKIDYGFTTFL